MSTARLPQGAVMPGVGVTVLSAPGRPDRPHVSAGPLKGAMAWLYRLRQLQADGLSITDAIAQADAEEEARLHPVPGRRNRKDGA